MGQVAPQSGVMLADMVARVVLVGLAGVLTVAEIGVAQQSGAPGRLRVALVTQPFIPNGTSVGPETMASGGIQRELRGLGVDVGVTPIALTPEQEPEYGGWKRLAYALGHLGRAVSRHERNGDFTVGLLGTCPSLTSTRLKPPEAGPSVACQSPWPPGAPSPACASTLDSIRPSPTGSSSWVAYG